MSTNPYAPPQAHVADVTPTGALPVFFATTTLKLVLLSLATLGLYQIYWFYQNWRLHRQRTGEKVSPVWRAVFAVFFCYPLFLRIRDYEETSEDSKLLAGPLATAWIVPTLLSRLPDPYWLITFASVFALIPVQSRINQLNAQFAPGHDPNTQFSVWNWLAIVLGLPFLALALVGTFFLPPE